MALPRRTLIPTRQHTFRLPPIILLLLFLLLPMTTFVQLDGGAFVVGAGEAGVARVHVVWWGEQHGDGV